MKKQRDLLEAEVEGDEEVKSSDIVIGHSDS